MAERRPRGRRQPDAIRAPDPPELPGDELRQLAAFWAERLCRTLGLECSVLYLYDAPRENLIEVGRCGPPFEHRATIPLAPGANLGDLEITPGEPGGGLSLPLWDSRRLVGVVYGRMPAGQSFDPGRLDIGRESALGAAVSLSQKAAPAAPAEAPPPPRAGRPEGPTNRDTRYPQVTRYLQDQVTRLAAAEVLSLALLSFRSQGGHGRIPVRGVALGDSCPGGRGFSVGPAATRLWVVCPGTGREDLRGLLERLASGALPLSGLFARRPGAKPHDSTATPPRMRAAAFAIYPEDADSAEGLLTAVTELLDLQVYLRSSYDEEGRGEAPDLDTEPAAAVMDSCRLAAEIDKLRQVLAEQIESGHGFQDPPVRHTSEQLDRLIVAMQRLMGHRGAVP